MRSTPRARPPGTCSRIHACVVAAISSALRGSTVTPRTLQARRSTWTEWSTVCGMGRRTLLRHGQHRIRHRTVDGSRAEVARMGLFRRRRVEEELLELVRTELGTIRAEIQATLGETAAVLSSRVRTEIEHRMGEPHALAAGLQSVRNTIGARDAELAQVLKRVIETCDTLSQRVELDRSERIALTEAVGRLTDAVAAADSYVLPPTTQRCECEHRRRGDRRRDDGRRPLAAAGHHRDPAVGRHRPRRDRGRHRRRRSSRAPDGPPAPTASRSGAGSATAGCRGSRCARCCASTTPPPATACAGAPTGRSSRPCSTRRTCASSPPGSSNPADPTLWRRFGTDTGPK